MTPDTSPFVCERTHLLMELPREDSRRLLYSVTCFLPFISCLVLLSSFPISVNGIRWIFAPWFYGFPFVFCDSKDVWCSKLNFWVTKSSRETFVSGLMADYYCPADEKNVRESRMLYTPFRVVGALCEWLHTRRVWNMWKWFLCPNVNFMNRLTFPF